MTTPPVIRNFIDALDSQSTPASNPSTPPVITNWVDAFRSQYTIASNPSTPPQLTNVVETLQATYGGGVALGEVQLLGTLIGPSSSLTDTGTADALNLLLSSQQAFSGIDWLATNITPADSGQTDPFGGSTASTLTETTDTSNHFIAQAWYPAASAAQFTVLAYIKQSLRTRGIVIVRDLQAPGTNNAFCTYDLAGVQIGVAAAKTGNFASPSATVTAESNGFVLCTLTFTTNATGTFDVEIYADAGSGTGAGNSIYAGNASSPALILGAVGVYSGASGTYVPLNSNLGLAGTTVQQAFSPNGGTTAYWGTQTSGAYVGFDFGVPVTPTRARFAPRPSPAGVLTTPYQPYIALSVPDHAHDIAGSLLQTSVADSTFASPTTIATLPAVGSVPYYPRYWLSELPFSPGLTPSRYFRFKPPTVSFGGLSELQVFAVGGTTANACPVQPVITPNGGQFPSLTTSVAMSSLTTGASIYYTVGTVGSPPADPTTASTLYTGPFTQAVGSGAQVLIKAIAYLASLSTPTSLVTTSAPFNGYGFKPNVNWYAQSGNLIEAHAGGAVWDPNTSAWYWVGQFMNVGSRNTPGEAWNDPIAPPGVFLYKGISLDAKDPTGILNWKNLGNILTGAPVAGQTGSRYHMLYNALNNNYVIFADPVVGSGQQSCYYASTSGADITSGWSWNLTPIITNVFSDFSTFVDSDGVTAYLIWHNLSTATKIQQLNTSYTNVTGSALTLTGGASREAPVMWKYPNVTGGTYYMITSQLNAYNSSSGAFDLRYITNTGSSPLANSWSASPAAGASAWATDPGSTNFNGQPTFVTYIQGSVQPVIALDYWLGQGAGALGLNYGSRYIFQPIVMTPTTAQIQQLSSWDPSSLGTTYSPQALTLSGSTFAVGNAQGTVIGSVQNYLAVPWVTLSDDHSGAVQLVAGVIQVGPTPPGTPGSFNISLLETPTLGTPRTTVISITENAVSGSLSGSVFTSQSTQATVNLTTLAASGLSDWAAFGADAGTVGSIERKATGGSAISTLTQVGTQALGASNHIASTPHWPFTWTDGSPDATPTPDPEGFQVFCTSAVIGNGMSFTVPADTTSRTLLVYVWLSGNSPNPSSAKLVATLSDASATAYTDTTLSQTSATSLLGLYTIIYAAASASQHLTVSWTVNTTNSQAAGIWAAVIE